MGDRMLRRSMRVPSQPMQFPALQLVADEQVVGDGLHLLGGKQHRIAPPFLKFEEARGFGIDIREDIVGLLPQCVGGVEAFKIGDEIRAINHTVA